MADNKKIIGQLLEIAVSFFASKAKSAPTPAPAPAPVQKQPEPKSEPIKQADPGIDWSNPKAKISKHFTVEEAIMLREWKRLANESDGLNDHVKAQLVRIFREVMDPIRELLGKPVFIKSAYRPQAYNVAIGGAKKSAHMCVLNYAAVDFWTDQDGDGDKDGKDCDDIKAILMPLLAKMNIRLEDNGKGARWVHVDNREVPPGGNRFFKP